MTYQNLLQTTRRQLLDCEAENPTLEAHELLCHCGKRSKAQLLQDLGETVPPEVATQLQDLLARRLNREPLAYLLEEWDFYGLRLTLSPQVLIPRIDSEVLAQRAIQLASKRGGKVLDLCAGSGCLGLSIAKSIPSLQVVLGEISPPALEICQENIRRCQLDAQVTAQKMDCLAPPERDLAGKFSLLVANPPYIPSGDIPKLDPMVRDFEPHLALDGGPDGLDFYRAIAKDWKSVLAPGGYLLFEVGIYQFGMVENILEDQGFVLESSIQDSQDIARVVQGHLP